MNHTVLFVDDDKLLLESLRRSLRSEPYKTMWAYNADEAMQIVSAEKIDVIVSDESMPGVTGNELLAWVRLHHPDIIPIMMSGSATCGTITRALNDGGIYRFLIKPASAQDVISAVRAALSYKSVIDGCRRLLPLFRAQTAAIIAAKIQGPTHLALAGKVFLKDDFENMEVLAERIADAIHQGEKLLE